MSGSFSSPPCLSYMIIVSVAENTCQIYALKYILYSVNCRSISFFEYFVLFGTSFRCYSKLVHNFSYLVTWSPSLIFFLLCFSHTLKYEETFIRALTADIINIPSELIPLHTYHSFQHRCHDDVYTT